MSHTKKVSDIQSITVKRKISVNGQNVIFDIRTAQSGIIDGNRIVLDELMIDNMVGGFARALESFCTKYNPLPSEIILSDPDGDGSDPEKTEARDIVNKSGILESFEPRFGFNDVVLPESVLKQINIAISAVKYRDVMVDDWGMSGNNLGNRAIILNFHGKPGTGKSMAAEAIAKELGKKVFIVNYAELESKYVGETPKNIRAAFKTASDDDAVLVFDEADSFLGKRLTSVSQSADYGVNLTRSVLFMELEKYNGVVVFTTNLMENYDEAFKRRILLSIHFDLPDRAARERIWRLHIGDRMPLGADVTFDELANRYEKVSGADIKDTVFYAALHSLSEGNDKVGLQSFDYAYQQIKNRYTDIDRPEIIIEKLADQDLTAETGGVG